MKPTKIIVLAIFTLLFFETTKGQDSIPQQIGPYDSLATAHMKDLVTSYAAAMHTLFNEPLNEAKIEDERFNFTGLFDKDAYLVQDYIAGIDDRKASGYFHSANKWFRDINPTYEIEILWESLEMNHYPYDDYYICNIFINNTFKHLYDTETEKIIEQRRTSPLLLAMKVTRDPSGSSILMISAQEEPVAIVDNKVEDKKQPVQRVKRERAPWLRDESSILAFISVGLGGDLGFTQFNSESEFFDISEHSNASFSGSVNFFIPVAKNGWYIGAGVGILSGQLELDYENTTYSFEYVDNQNPVEQPGQATPANVESYIRTASVNDFKETIKYQDFTVHILLSKNLLKAASNKYFLVSGGLSVGIPTNETSELSATTDYHGYFHTINGFETNLTLGVNEDIPEYGFERRESAFDFELDSKVRFNALFSVNGGIVLGDRIYTGLGIDALIPLNSWLDGNAEHETIFKTKSDLNESLANTVIQSTRPLRLGLSIQLGFFF